MGTSFLIPIESHKYVLLLYEIELLLLYQLLVVFRAYLVSLLKNGCLSFYYSIQLSALSLVFLRAVLGLLLGLLFVEDAVQVL